MSEKIINIKNVLTLMLICCFLWINGITVHAESQAVNEKEPQHSNKLYTNHHLPCFLYHIQHIRQGHFQGWICSIWEKEK